MERDGSTIVPEEVQRYVNESLVHFIEYECRFIVIEGIHRVIVSNVISYIFVIVRVHGVYDVCLYTYISCMFFHLCNHRL